MNEKTIKLLEYDKIKERLADYTISEIGNKMVIEMQPSFDLRTIENKMLETTEAKKMLSSGSSIPLHPLTGIPHLLEKTGKGFVLDPEELSALAGFLKDGKKMKRYMKERAFSAPMVSAYALSISEFDEMREEIEKSICSGMVESSASPELARARKKISAAEERIKSRLDSILRSPVMRVYLQDHLVSQRGDRYVIPVKNEYRKNVRGSVLDYSASGSTVFIEPEEISRLQDELKLARVQEENEVYRILSHLTSLAAAGEREIRINLEVMAQYDFAFAKAKYSRAMEGEPVQFNEKNRIRLLSARHPLIGSGAVPLDLNLGIDYRAFIITGPNTGGKTVALKTVGLLTMMAQSGLHVPAAAGSELAVFHKILADIGDGQSIEQSLSSFSSHIKNIKEIIDKADSRTLVLLDELGAGTDPEEGMGLAVSILETLFDKRVTMMATTHYSEIKDFARDKKGFENGCMAFDINTLKPLYRLKTGEPGESNAFLIALRLGVDRRIIERAHVVTYHEEKSYAGYLSESPHRLPVSVENKEGRREKTVPVPKTINQKAENQITKNQKEEHQIADKQKQSACLNIGDCVLINALGTTGIVYELENSRGEVGVMVQTKKMKISRKRISLYIAARELYPENYDMDIIFETKENRKKRHLMSRKHQTGMVIKTDPSQ